LRDYEELKDMSFSNKLVKLYFDLVYNTLYNLTTARLSAYRKWQDKCLGKLKFANSDSILCVGVGTGNEIPHILNRHRDMEVIGVDPSVRALRKAHQKGLRQGKEIKVFEMEAQELQYPAESFNKVLCLHVMDFVEDHQKATEEVIRVLREGGQFVITYPSDKEGVNLGINLLKDSWQQDIQSRKYGRALANLLGQAGLGILYLPLTLRAKQKAYAYHDLESVFTKLKLAYFQIEEYTLYKDLIVYGEK